MDNKVAPLEERMAAKCKYSKTYSPSLIKAVWDPHWYALGLKSGQVFRFESAEYVDENWVRLLGATLYQTYAEYADIVMWTEDHLSFARGVEVKVDDIAWCAGNPGRCK